MRHIKMMQGSGIFAASCSTCPLPWSWSHWSHLWQSQQLPCVQTDIIDVWSMDLAHISQITLSRSYWLVWSRDGVHGKHTIYTSVLLINIVATDRCTACNNDLDGLGGPCSQELREALIDVLEPQVLWDEYGIVYDVVVWCFSQCFILHV